MIDRLLCLVGQHAPMPIPYYRLGNLVAIRLRCLGCKKDLGRYAWVRRR